MGEKTFLVELSSPFLFGAAKFSTIKFISSDMPQNSVMGALAALKVLESPIGLITQKRNDERKSYKKSCWPIPKHIVKIWHEFEEWEMRRKELNF